MIDAAIATELLVELKREREELMKFLEGHLQKVFIFFNVAILYVGFYLDIIQRSGIVMIRIIPLTVSIVFMLTSFILCILIIWAPKKRILMGATLIKRKMNYSKNSEWILRSHIAYNGRLEMMTNIRGLMSRLVTYSIFGMVTSSLLWVLGNELKLSSCVHLLMLNIISIGLILFIFILFIPDVGSIMKEIKNEMP